MTGELKVWRRDRWVATKDLGRVDADGYFFHGGRADDVIISAGWTIGAVEVEDAILKHPDVREAAAIGVADELRGQVVKAFVVLREGHAGDVRALQEHVKATIAPYKYPRAIEFRTSLPRTETGKLQRFKLRETR